MQAGTRESDMQVPKGARACPAAPRPKTAAESMRSRKRQTVEKAQTAGKTLVQSARLQQQCQYLTCGEPMPFGKYASRCENTGRLAR